MPVVPAQAGTHTPQPIESARRYGSPLSADIGYTRCRPLLTSEVGNIRLRDDRGSAGNDVVGLCRVEWGERQHDPSSLHRRRLSARGETAARGGGEELFVGRGGGGHHIDPAAAVRRPGTGRDPA